MKSVKPITPCEHIDAELKAYLDGELPFPKRWQVRAHLARCPQCQEELKLMQTLEKEVQTEEVPPLESDLRMRILSSAPQPSLKPVVGKSRRVSPKLAFGLGGLALVVALFIVPVMTQSSAPTDFSSGMDPVVDNRKIGAVSSAPGIRMETESASSSAASAPTYQRQADDVTNQYKRRSYPVLNVTERSVHKEGSLTVDVDNAETAGNSVEALVKNAGGFVANNALSTGVGGMRSATMDVRIPVSQFESIVKKVGALGTMRATSIRGEDITTKVAVAGARKETLSYELAMAQARLRELNKKSKANSAEVYQSRAEVRSLNLQAAAALAELKTLQKFAALSTLYVTLQDKGKTPAPASFSGTLGQTGNEAWASFLNSARLPIQLVIWILAYSPLWVPAWIIWRRFGKKLVLGD